MKGLKTVSKASQNILFNDPSTYIKLYYSVKEDKVYMKEGESRYFMTNLINPNTEKDIERTVNYFMNM